MRVVLTKQLYSKLRRDHEHTSTSVCGFLKRWRPGAVREHLERNCWTAFALQRVSATQHTHSLCLFPFTSLSYRHISGSKWLGRRPRLRWRRTTSRQRRPGLPTRHGGQGSRAQRERNVMASPLRLFRCEEWQEAAQSQLQPANAHGSKRRRTRKRMRPMAAAAMANMQHAPITCCSQVKITRSCVA